MSYSLYIGNAELVAEWGGEDGPVAEWVVKRTTHAEAPAFPFDVEPHVNARHPGYVAWSEFCEETGLHALFYGVAEPGHHRAYGGILSEHPGIVPLTSDMLTTVRDARERWQRSHPGAVPGFNYNEFNGKPSDDDGVRDRDYNLARLLWLEWWMDYALRNCERPAISNT